MGEYKGLLSPNVSQSASPSFSSSLGRELELSDGSLAIIVSDVSTKVLLA
jgi:hypothetical protein